MKRIFKMNLISVVTFLLTTQIVTADDTSSPVNFSGEIRVRGEFDNRDFNSETAGYNYSRLRTRLNIKSQPAENVLLFAQIQDSRDFGTEDTSGYTGTLANFQNLDLRQGYFQIWEFFVPWLSIKAGRMTLAYGGQRLLGENPWSNTGRAFDAARLTIKINKIMLDIFNASLVETYQDGNENDGDQFLTGVWGYTQFHESHSINFYYLFDADKQRNEANDWKLRRSTTGVRVESNVGDLTIETEFNYQFGSMAYNSDISALYFISTLEYGFHHPWKPRFSIGFDYLSGDDPNSKKFEAFNTLYPARHRFFGYMDYFKEFPKHASNAGLNDLRFRATLSPLAKLNLQGDLHLFHLSQKVMLADESESNKIGKELDVRLKYGYLKNVNFDLGVGVFLPDEVFKQWKGSDTPLWFYGATSVSF